MEGSCIRAIAMAPVARVRFSSFGRPRLDAGLLTGRKEAATGDGDRRLGVSCVAGRASWGWGARATGDRSADTGTADGDDEFPLVTEVKERLMIPASLGVGALKMTGDDSWFVFNDQMEDLAERSLELCFKIANCTRPPSQSVLYKGLSKCMNCFGFVAEKARTGCGSWALAWPMEQGLDMLRRIVFASRNMPLPVTQDSFQELPPPCGYYFAEWELLVLLQRMYRRADKDISILLIDDDTSATEVNSGGDVGVYALGASIFAPGVYSDDDLELDLAGKLNNLRTHNFGLEMPDQEIVVKIAQDSFELCVKVASVLQPESGTTAYKELWLAGCCFKDVAAEATAAYSRWKHVSYMEMGLEVLVRTVSSSVGVPLPIHLTSAVAAWERPVDHEGCRCFLSLMERRVKRVEMDIIYMLLLLPKN